MRAQRTGNGRHTPILDIALLALVVTLGAPAAIAQEAGADTAPTAREILERVDANYVTKARTTTTRMIIRGRRGTRELVAKAWIEGDKALSEYVAPARERGTKMLKLGDKLWTYTPSSDRIITIAGHLLRSSMSGSDLSYEDFMQDPHLASSYDAKLVGQERKEGRDCYVLELRAKRGADAAYHARKIWVDKASFLPIEQKLYAKSGKPLKTMTIEEVLVAEGRHYPKRLVVKDLLLGGKGTQVIVEEVDFDADIPRSRFSKGALRR